MRAAKITGKNNDCMRLDRPTYRKHVSIINVSTNQLQCDVTQYKLVLLTVYCFNHRSIL